MTKESNYRTGEVTQLRRIADALEEVLRLVKEDQERSKKYMEQPEEGDMRDHFKKAVVNEQKERIGEYSDPDRPLALASGTRAKLQAASGKLQASSGKLDKTTL